MVRIGIIGTGKIVHEFLEEAGQVGDVEFAGVCSRSMKRAEEMAWAYGAEMAFDSLEAMAACESIDAVYVASPNSCHCSQAGLMLEHGKHVLCEKPAVTNAKEWEMLVRTAKKHQVVLIEAMRSAFDPGFQRIEELLPKLGTVRRATLQYSQYSSRYDAFKAGEILNAFCPELSNAAMMDIGVYCIYGMVRLFGEPEEVSAHSLFLENGMEGMGTLVAKYPQMQAEILYSKITDSKQPSEIQGEGGTLLIQTIQDPREFVLTLKGMSPEVIRLDKPDNNMCYEIRAFADMVMGKRKPGRYQAVTLAELRVMDQARKKAGILFPADDGRNCHG